jgi:hypothetical protein
MNLICTLLTVASILYTALYVTLVFILKENYKYYKPTYLALKNKEYLLYDYGSESLITFKPVDKIKKMNDMKASGDTFWSLPPNIYQYMLDDKAEIIYFKSGESIKLINAHYIHTHFMLFCDLYTLYWHKKIKKQILLNSMTIAESRDYKLKQLLQ